MSISWFSVPTSTPLSNVESSFPPALFHSPALAPFTHWGSKKEAVQKQQLLSPGWAQIHLPRVYPSAAVECVTPCPGAITVPLHTRFPQFITTIGACQLLLMIAQPHADERDYWLTEEVRSLGIAQTLSAFFFFFPWNLKYCSSSTAFCKLGQSVLYNLYSCCYFKILCCWDSGQQYLMQGSLHLWKIRLCRCRNRLVNVF